MPYWLRNGERVGFTVPEYERLLQAAHQRSPGGKIVLVCDNLGVHHSAVMRAFIDAHTDWQRVFYLPTYASELNPAENVWSLVKRSMANFPATELDHLAP
ncbi:MAG: transposase [Actinomadura sp.]